MMESESLLPTCKCRFGFTGPRCQQQPQGNPCEGVACGDLAGCARAESITAGTAGFTCICPPGQATDVATGICRALRSGSQAGGPTCFDGLRNGDEPGVDCGGSCVERCREGQECQVTPGNGACAAGSVCSPGSSSDKSLRCVPARLRQGVLLSIGGVVFRGISEPQFVLGPAAPFKDHLVRSIPGARDASVRAVRPLAPRQRRALGLALPKAIAQARRTAEVDALAPRMPRKVARTLQEQSVGVIIDIEVQLYDTKSLVDARAAASSVQAGGSQSVLLQAARSALTDVGLDQVATVSAASLAVEVEVRASDSVAEEGPRAGPPAAPSPSKSPAASLFPAMDVTSAAIGGAAGVAFVIIVALGAIWTRSQCRQQQSRKQLQMATSSPHMAGYPTTLSSGMGSPGASASRPRQVASRSGDFSPRLSGASLAMQGNPMLGNGTPALSTADDRAAQAPRRARVR